MKKYLYLLLIICSLNADATERCQVLLTGGQHLGSRRAFVENTISQFVSNPNGSIRADFLDIFNPSDLFYSLERSGVSTEKIERIKSLLDRAFEAAHGGFIDNVSGGFAILNAHHDPNEALVNVCIVGKECNGFTVNGSQRSYINIGVSGPVVVDSIDKVDTGEPVRNGADFYLNLIHLDAGASPENFVVNLFSGLGLAQMANIVGAWAEGISRSPRASPLFRRMGRNLADKIVVDAGFFLFMQNMSAHIAEQELFRIFGNDFSVEVIDRPGSMFNISNVLERLSGHPISKTFLDKNVISEQNAIQTYENLKQQLFSDIQLLSI